MHAREEVAVDDIRSAAVDYGLLVCCWRIRLLGRNEGRSYVGEVRARRLGSEHRSAIGDCAREYQRAIEPGANLLEQCKWRPSPGVTSGAGGDRNDSIGAFIDCLPGKVVIDHVMQRDPAP